MTFHNRVQERRESLGNKLGKPITQQDIAKTVGCSRVTIWKIENGVSQPGIVLALKICKALDCEPWDIFLIKDSPTPLNQTKPPPPAAIPEEFAELIKQYPELADEVWKLPRAR